MLTKNTLRSFSSASLFESGIYCGATSYANFTNWRLATSVFRRLTTEALHPPFYTFGGTVAHPHCKQSRNYFNFSSWNI